MTAPQNKCYHPFFGLRNGGSERLMMFLKPWSELKAKFAPDSKSARWGRRKDLPLCSDPTTFQSMLPSVSVLLTQFIFWSQISWSPALNFFFRTFHICFWKETCAQTSARFSPNAALNPRVPEPSKDPIVLSTFKLYVSVFTIKVYLEQKHAKYSPETWDTGKRCLYIPSWGLFKDISKLLLYSCLENPMDGGAW